LYRKEEHPGRKPESILKTHAGFDFCLLTRNRIKNQEENS